jgi:hypothetical protein
MKRKYKKEKAIMVDLSNRKNIRIIESEKISYSDEDVEFFRQQVEDKTKAIEDFNDYIIKKGIESKRHISDDEFQKAMKDLLKQHKMLKYLLEEQD